MGNIAALHTPLQSKTVARFGDRRMKGASCSMQGFRHDQEDRHTSILSLEHHSDSSYFAVYDGHCGDTASQFCAKVIHERIDDLPELEDQAIRDVILKADKEFLDQKVPSNGGSTLVACIVEHVEDGTKCKGKEVAANVQAINVGDSRALIIRQKGTFKSLTKDHKPDRSDERKRIQNAGGFVANARVDGQLAVSRAFGDAPYKKQRQLSPTKQKVTAVADITHNVAYPGDFLLVACDGLFEELESKQVAGIALKKLQETNDPAKTLCHLFHEAIKSGSKDNMSALIIQFTDGTDYHRNSTHFVPGPFGTIIDETTKISGDVFFDRYFAECMNYGFLDGPVLRRMAYESELIHLNNMPDVTEETIDDIEREIRKCDIESASLADLRHLVNAQTLKEDFLYEFVERLERQNIKTVSKLRKLIKSKKNWDSEKLFSDELKRAIMHNMRRLEEPQDEETKSDKRETDVIMEENSDLGAPLSEKAEMNGSEVAIGDKTASPLSLAISNADDSMTDDVATSSSKAKRSFRSLEEMGEEVEEDTAPSTKRQKTGE